MDSSAGQTSDMRSDMVPVIDIGPLRAKKDRQTTAAALGAACRDTGFFYVVNHGVDENLQRELEAVSRRFFSLDLSEKMKIEMARGGNAWRGFFPVGQELTSGKPDRKEGIYFGKEMSASSVPLHGPNLFPAAVPEMKRVVLEYMDALTHLGHTLMEGLALSLGLEESYFHARYTADPFLLFRIFHYPPADEPEWGVGEHTDYGVLTILKQDDKGGLEVRSKGGWMAAPPIPNSFICNLGDMLDRMTGGLYRSTPHRVRSGPHSRLSFPFFFDPAFSAEVKPIPTAQVRVDDKDQRWDGASVHAFRGTYGEYLMGKVAKVFPGLGKTVFRPY